MGALSRFAGGRRGRWIWLGLAVVLAAGLAATFVVGGGQGTQALDDAAGRAKRYAETVLFENLDPKLVEDQIFGPQYRQGELLGPKYRQLLIAVQDTILVDPFVTRVRIWDEAGLLVFSSDRDDEIGQDETADGDAIAAAVEGRTTDTLTGGTLVTVTPLRIPGQLKVHAIAGIEQDADAIVSAATSSPSGLRLPLIVALVLSMMLFAVGTAFPEPAPRAPREEPERVEVDRVEIERVVEPDPEVVAERDRLRADVETASGYIRELEGELEAARALAASAPVPSTEASGSWLTDELQQSSLRIRQLEERLAVETDRADAAEGRIGEAEQRARVAEERARDLENYFPSIDASATERSGDAPSEEQLREYEMTLRNAAVRQLRGPVSRVRGAVLAMKEEVSSSKGREMMERLETASSRLDQLVADLESLSHLVDGTLPLRLWSTEIDRVVERVVTGWKKETERDVTVDTQPVTVPVDQGRLQQILETLLEDAHERTDPTEVLQVKVRPHAEGGVVIVEAPGELPQRADLQLALARRFVELHGGRIWYEPRPGVTAILVMFPSERPAEIPATLAEPETERPAAG